MDRVLTLINTAGRFVCTTEVQPACQLATAALGIPILKWSHDLVRSRSVPSPAIS